VWDGIPGPFKTEKRPLHEKKPWQTPHPAGAGIHWGREGLFQAIGPSKAPERLVEVRWESGASFR